jgi:alpha-1,6-mannosyltransferase
LKPLYKKQANYTFYLIYFASIYALHHFIPRHDALTLGLVYLISFATYGWIVWIGRPQWQIILWLGLGARLAISLGIPSLSDDFYRFLWDGHLLNSGISPYQFLPSELLDKDIFDQQNTIYPLLNSPNYYSVYTPIHQLIFWTAVRLSDHLQIQVMIMKAISILFDLSGFLILKKLSQTKMKGILGIFFLNPLLIIEGTGNLHIEGILVSVIIAVFYFIHKSRLSFAGILTGFAIGLKLLPAIIVPAIAWKYRWRKGALYGISSLFIATILITSWFFNDHLQGILSSLSLYQKTFEFNASIYYLAREVGFWHKGYNIIGTLGPWLSRISALLIIGMAILGHWKKRPIAETVLYCWTIYLLLSTTVHPWYILPLLPLGLLSGYHYPILWSGLIFVSYFGYSSTGYTPTFGWIFFEYFILYAYIIYELRKNFNKDNFATDQWNDH